LTALVAEIAHAVKGVNRGLVFGLLPMWGEMALLTIVRLLILPGHCHKSECPEGKKQGPKKGYCHYGKEHQFQKGNKYCCAEEQREKKLDRSHNL
jgi:hypothetical protein